MEKVLVTGVPEHFNYPWIQLVRRQPFKSMGFELIWKDEPKGSGAMNQSIRNGETDLAIILTESFIKDSLEGNQGKIIGLHVASPLTWGIHVSALNKSTALSELSDQPFLISRFGSGSHLMAFLLAKREGWVRDQLNFEVIGDLEGAKKAFSYRNKGIFLWEKFTTKPLVDQGMFKRIGEIPTPWPCFVIVASERFLKQHPKLANSISHEIHQQNTICLADPNLSQKIGQTYGLKAKDVQNWLAQTTWAKGPEISKAMLENSMNILLELGLIQSVCQPEDLIYPSAVNLVG